MHIQESRIRLLPEHVIDQIKAGEVVERPAHIIKELIENSLDAGSNKIEINLINNGLDLIHIKDNGHGMGLDELPLAFCRHATSKLQSFDDIYALNSFGFRGEALASLSSVSKVTCESHPKTGPSGRIQMEGPVTINHCTIESNNSIGTQIFIKELFFNTPARLKFMNSSRAEKNYLKKVLYSYFIANPEIEFHLKWDEEDKLILPSLPRERYLDRVNSLILKKESLEWKSSESLYGPYEARVSLTASRAKSKLQYIFVNGRPIYDKQIHAMVQNLSSSMNENAQSGHYFIFINAHPASIDVNIHPHKTQVKFEQASEVLALIRAVVKQCYETQKQNSRVVIKNIVEQTQLLNPLDDLKDLKPSKQHAIAHSIEQEMNFTEGPQLSKVSDRYYLQSSKENYSIINMNLLLKFLFKNNHKLEQKSTPLLISIPIRTQKDTVETKLDAISNLGFEVDPISNREFLIREIPLCFAKLHIQDFISYLFDSSMKEIKDVSNFESIYKTLSNRDIEQLLREVSQQELDTFNIAVKLTDQNIPKLTQK